MLCRVVPLSIEYSRVHTSALAVAVIVPLSTPQDASVPVNERATLFAKLSTVAVAVAVHPADVHVTS